MLGELLFWRVKSRAAQHNGAARIPRDAHIAVVQRTGKTLNGVLHNTTITVRELRHFIDHHSSQSLRILTAGDANRGDLTVGHLGVHADGNCMHLLGECARIEQSADGGFRRGR